MASTNGAGPSFMYANFWDSVYVESRATQGPQENRKDIGNDKAENSLLDLIRMLDAKDKAPNAEQERTKACSGNCKVTEEGQFANEDNYVENMRCIQTLFDGKEGRGETYRPPKVDFIAAFRDFRCSNCGVRQPGQSTCFARVPNPYSENIGSEGELLRLVQQQKMEKLPSTDAERRYGFAGSCEIIVKKRTSETLATSKPGTLGKSTKSNLALPFSAALCDWFQEYFHLIPHWLVHRKNDTGVALVAGDASQVKSYLFQTPFYGDESPEWSLSMAVRNPGDFERYLELQTEQAAGQKMDPNKCFKFEDGFVCMKTIGVLEVNADFKVNQLLEAVQSLASQFRHPLLVPVQLLFWHIQESSRQFMELEHALREVEEQLSAANQMLDDFTRKCRPYDVLNIEFGSINENLYRSNKMFSNLERRFDFEGRFGNIILKAICWGYKKCRVTSDNERPLVNWFAGINKLHRTAQLAEKVQATLDTSQARALDMKRLPDRIKSLRKTLRDLIAQQDSQASLQENRQVKKLTEASVETADRTAEIAESALRDSYSMKIITGITTFFLPGTFLASFFSDTLFVKVDGSSYPSVSPMFWIWLGLTGLMTVVVFGGWQMWIWHNSRRAASIQGRRQSTLSANSQDEKRSGNIS